MIRNNLLILIITFTQLSLFSQDTTTPAEMEIVLKEEFSNTSSSFPIITTIDNYFIIDNGDYLMSRNNTQDEYIILSSNNHKISDFHLEASIKIGPSSNKKSSVGIVLKSELSKDQYLTFEINRHQEFRIRGSMKDQESYRFFSGEPNNEGWVKDSKIRGENEYNLIRIVCSNNNYDIYINNAFLTKFSSPENQEGRMGIIISKNSKARLDYYYLRAPLGTLGEEKELIKNNTKFRNRDIDSLNKIITSLRNELAVTKTRLASTGRESKSYKNTHIELLEKEKYIEKNINLQKQIDSLKRRVSDLTVSEENKTEKIYDLNNLINELNLQIKNMHEVLIYKGFDEKGIISEDVKAVNIEDKSKEDYSEYIYTVQLATYGTKVNIKMFHDLSDVFYNTSDNETYLYMSGKFNNSNDAVEHKNILLRMGYINAFVLKVKHK